MLKFQEWSKKSAEGIIRDYIGLILGGLAGTTTMMSATLLALTKLAHTLRADLPADIIQLLLDNICLLISSPTREVVGCCVGFIKLFVSAFPKDDVLPYLPQIVKAIVSMTDDCKRHFRLKTRDIIDRLLRKYGYETIQPLFPSHDIIMQKRLKNLRRINIRKKQPKPVPEEDNVVDDFAIKSKPKRFVAWENYFIVMRNVYSRATLS